MKIKTFIKLGDICDISAGQGAPQGDSNYCDNGTPFVKAGNLIELLQGKNETDIQKVSEDVAKKHKLKKYTAGSILFAKSGMSCMKGYVYQLKNDSYVVSHLAIVKPIKDSSDYIEYCLRHIKPNSLVKDEAYPSISLQDISNLKIPLPSLEEQIKISKQLYICTQIINKHKKQLERYDTLIKSRFIEMFGDPVINEKDWDLKTLPELGEFGRGVSKHRPRNAPELLGGKYPLIQTGDVANANLYITDYESTYSEEGFKQSKMWKAGTLCITIAATIAKTAILTFDSCFPDSVVGFTPNEKTNSLFINYWFSFFQKILEEQAPAVAQKNINLQVLSELKIITPPISLQNNFAAFVQQIDKSKFAVQKSLEKTETLYKSLMQRYFA